MYIHIELYRDYVSSVDLGVSHLHRRNGAPSNFASFNNDSLLYLHCAPFLHWRHVGKTFWYCKLIYFFGWEKVRGHPKLHLIMGKIPWFPAPFPLKVHPFFIRNRPCLTPPYVGSLRVPQKSGICCAPSRGFEVLLDMLNVQVLAAPVAGFGTKRSMQMDFEERTSVSSFLWLKNASRNGLRDAG
jgi:hypothetical protein